MCPGHIIGEAFGLRWQSAAVEYQDTAFARQAANESIQTNANLPAWLRIPFVPIPRAESPSCDSPAEGPGIAPQEFSQALKERHKLGVICFAPAGQIKIVGSIPAFSPFKARHSPIDNQDTAAYTGKMKSETNHKTAVE